MNCPSSYPSDDERKGQETIRRLLLSDVVPEDERPDQLGRYLRRQVWGRFIFLLEIYKRILPVHGIVMEFGVRWGQNMTLFTSFRGLFEPFNYNRKIVGFDTFAGFPSIDPKDGSAREVKVGNYAVGSGYEETLGELLTAHEQQAPLSHICKHELVKGDVQQTLERYLTAHPETIVALAYFDLDLYEPTRYCLERVLPLMPRGAIIGFDELNYERFPGETRALKEVLSLRQLRLERLPCNPLTSFAVLD